MKSSLQQVIRVLKHSGNALDDISDVELAKIANTYPKYIQRNKRSIVEYFDTAPEPTKSDFNYFENRSLQVYIQLASSTNTKFIYRDVLGAIVGHLLRWDYKLLGHIHKNTKVIATGQAIVELMCLVYSRKDTKKGTPIYSNSKSARYLLNSNRIAFIDELFKRSDSYYAGNKSKQWKLTNLSEQVLQQAIDIFFKQFSNICPTNSETYSSICFPVKWTTLSIDILNKQSITSILQILAMTIAYSNKSNSLIVSVEHTAKTDETLGRSYNFFGRIRESERKEYGYIGYDINAALQNICLQHIGASESDYPILTSYSTDKAFKTSLRVSIADDLNVSRSDVKQKLTAFANGDISGKDKHPMYTKFQEESDRLRREVLAHTAKHNPWLMEKAIEQSTRNLPEDIDWFNLDPEDSQTMARNKASVFFFIWTYYERLIRKAMLQCLPDGIEVHDAVYSKVSIDVKKIEDVVFRATNFKIIIDVT